MGKKSRKNKRSKDKKLLSIFLVCSLMFLGIVGFSIGKIVQVAKAPKKENISEKLVLLKDKNSLKEKESSNTKKDENKKEEGKEVTVKISAIGDCTLGSDTNFRGNTFTSVYNKENNPGYFFAGVKEFLSNDDITIANLEGPLSENGTKADKKFAFRGKPEYTKILTEGSVEAVNLANNHSMDYGKVSFEDTKKYLKESNVEYFGYDNKSIIEKNGIKIGLLGYKGWNNNETIRKDIENDIKNLKKEVNMVVVSFHWGDEGASTPNKTQKTLGRHAVDSGADLVLGHHPHVIQGIEDYNGKSIVYSLGNFCFGGNTNPKDKDSFIFKQNFTFDANKNLVKISHNETIPVSISSSKNKNDYRPSILDGSDKEKVQDKIDERSALIK